MHHLVRLILAVTCFGAALTAAPALAQEDENPSTPGQIPNPGSYQGSMVLQQQSDRQDQSFRQQQSQPQSQSYGGHYGGGQYAPRYSGSAQSSGPSPNTRCYLMLERAASLAPLRGLVELGTSTQDPRYFTISRRPSAAEKPVLLRWAAGRRQCLAITDGIQPRFLQASRTLATATLNLIKTLAQGQLTYGDFAYRRAQNLADYNRWLSTQ